MNTAMKILLAIAILSLFSIPLGEAMILIGPVICAICIAIMIYLCFDKLSTIEYRIEKLEEKTENKEDEE